MVVKLTSREDAYADAHAIKLDRSSVSMERDDSRKIPTSQAKSVGNFRLAQITEKSDKSAVPTVDQIRRTIRAALTKKGVGAVTAAKEIGQERNYIRDFLEGGKESMKTEAMMDLAEYLDIDFKGLIVTKEKRQRRAG